MPTPHTPGGHAPIGHEPVGHHPEQQIPVDIGTPITNANATADVPTNYEICDRTGFRQYPWHLKKQWDGHYVRSKSFENRHPQEFVRSRGGDKQKGPQSPEGDDSFIATSIAPEDL
jgi:hypothetical protein